jgi:hypothetical protein
MVCKDGTRATRTTQASLDEAVDRGQGAKQANSPFSNDIVGSGREAPVENLSDLVSPVRPVYPGHETFPTDEPWIRIYSRLLGEEIVLVLRRNAVREAEEVCLDSVIYVVPEMEILRDYAEKPDVIRRLHAIKREMNGWLVRPKG